jgi:hypothetical protein
MSVTVSASILDRSVDRAVRMLDGIKNGAQKAVSGAINDVMKGARTQIKREVAKEVKIKVGVVAKSIKIVRATPKNLTSTLIGDSTRRPNLTRFGAKQTKKGVTYRIKKSGKRQRIDSAFIVKRGGKFGTAFKRQGKTRLPIVSLKGPSINAVILKNRIDQEATFGIAKKLPKRIEARVSLLIVREGVKSARRIGITFD